MVKIYNVIIGLALVAAFVGLLVSITPTPDSSAKPTMTLEERKEIATALNHYMWPDGTIIHKRLDNGWVCVEIDKHHLLVYTGGKSGFGVAADSCLEE